MQERSSCSAKNCYSEKLTFISVASLFTYTIKVVTLDATRCRKDMAKQHTNFKEVHEKYAGAQNTNDM